VEIEAWRRLLAFDGLMSVESADASIYAVTRFFIMRHLLEPVMGLKLTDSLMGSGAHPVLAHPNEIGGYDIIALLNRLRADRSWWFEKSGGAPKLISSGVHSAVTWLQNELGSDINSWTYGRIHQVTFEHVLGSVPLLARIFSVGPFPIGGDWDTPMLAAIYPEDPFNLGGWATHFKMCVDLGNMTDAFTIHSPGQSGSIASPHFADLVDLWNGGKTHPMLWAKKDVLAHESNHLVFRPK